MKTITMSLLIISIFVAPVLADMSGSYINLEGPFGPFSPEEEVTFIFTACNLSPDIESLSGVRITFPECHTVLGGTSEFCCYDLNIFPSNVALFIAPEGAGMGCLGLTVDILIGNDCLDGEFSIEWTMQGNGNGAPPNSVQGVITGPVADDSISWDAVKSLYR